MIYYVSNIGNDQSDGSINAPFQTINHAAQIAAPGDTVKVLAVLIVNGLILKTQVQAIIIELPMKLWRVSILS
ncbi:MAG: hypothetical protein E7568_06465 [Ruminococcaceae bacterium]|nr:hypothetical protein [Oscillospiraceae bacterium]